MGNKKRGVSDVIAAVLVIFLIIVMVVAAYSIINPLIRKSSEDIDARKVTVSIRIIRDSIIINESEGKLRLILSARDDDSIISSAKINVFGENGEKSYSLAEIPKTMEEKTYILNISGSGKIKEVLVFPVFEDGETGIGERNNVYDYKSKDIHEKLEVINPDAIAWEGCNPDWQCEEWDRCRVVYDINTLIENEVLLKGEQKRVCIDRNKCLSDSVERKECDSGGSVIVKKVQENSKEYLEVYDMDNKLISKLELIEGEYNILNIEIPVG